MSKTTETMNLFEQAFAMRHDRVRNAFEMRKKSFLEAAKVNPASAIRAAESVAETQYELSAWDYAAKVVAANVEKQGEKAAIEQVVASLVQHVMLRATEGQSTSAFANGVSHAEIVGTRKALEELQYLADHPAW